MDDSSLVNKIRPNMEEFINNQANINNFFTIAKKRHLQVLKSILLDYIINKIGLIPFNNIEDK